MSLSIAHRFSKILATLFLLCFSTMLFSQSHFKDDQEAVSRITAELTQKYGGSLSEAALQGYINAELASYRHHQAIYQKSMGTRPDGISAAGGVLEQDSLALVALYNSTNGPGWTNNSNWLSGSPVAWWANVSTYEGRVTYLYLGSNNLTGTLPAELGNLTGLVGLYLSNNNLSGSIPAELGNMSSLVSFSLSNNNLTGSIPSQLGNLSNVRYFHLDNNSLTGSIPPELGSLNSAIFLVLNNNDLSGSIPAELGNMASLQGINFSENQLSGTLPPELGNITTLTSFTAHKNQFTGSIPAEWANCTGMSYFSMYESGLSGALPPELGAWTSMFYFNIDKNNFSGSIPSEIGAWTGVQYLMMAGNQFSGSIPPELGNLTVCGNFNLAMNQLSGSIPPELGNLPGPGITWLCLNNNQLTGTVPVELNKIYQLLVDYNQLDGLPDFPASGTTPGFLNCDSNRLTFDDLEPNSPYFYVYCYRQAPVALTGPDSVNQGSPLTLSVNTGGTANIYRWFKDNVQIPGAALNTYTIPAAQLSDEAHYHCLIANTKVPFLTLSSDTNYVNVLSNPMMAVAPESHDFGLRRPGMGKTQMFTIYNSGEQPLQLCDVQLIGPDAGQFSIEGLTLPDEIRGNWHIEFNVTYNPTEDGSHRADLVFSSNCSLRPEVIAGLTGQCQTEDKTAPALLMAYPAPDVQAVPVGAPLLWHIRDAGRGLDMSTLQITVNNMPFVAGGMIKGGFPLLSETDSQGCMICCLPYEPLPPQSAVPVVIQVSDVADPPNTLDTAYTFITGIDPVGITCFDTVGVAGGTMVDDSLNVTLTFPPGVLSCTMPIAIGTAANLPALPDTVQGLGLNLHFWPDGLTFTAPVTVEIPYSQAMLDSAGITDPMELAIYYYVSSTGQWTRLAVISHTDTHITVEVSEFCYLTVGRTAQQSTAVGQPVGVLPDDFSLRQNYPNPFNPTTTISYDLPEAADVTLAVYDVNGRLVRRLAAGPHAAGCYQQSWDAADENGDTVPSGIYFCRLSSGSHRKIIRMILMK